MIFDNAHWTSLLPAVLAIIMALAFRQVLISLFAGVWLGAFLLADLDRGAPLTSFLGALTDFIVPAVAEPDHASILIFTLLIGGMVGITTDNGATAGIVRVLTRFVRTRVRAQLATCGMGIAIFFDDYTTAMVVGNTIRSLTDKMRISRAKLAYLIDSLAAPVAILAPISTWTGAMIAFIAAATISMDGFDVAPYTVFLASFPYNFYAVFTVFFALAVASTDRDFGPMLRSRERLKDALLNPAPDRTAVSQAKEEETETAPRVSHWANAAVPILVLVVGSVVGLLVTGSGDSLQEVLATADSYVALLWASLLSIAVAMVLTVSQRLMKLSEMMESMSRGMFTMFEGLMILVLAWGLSAVTRDLGAAEYLVGAFGQTLDPLWLPAIAFLLASFTSFSTGSSWGTLGILMPLTLPLAWNLGLDMSLPMDAVHSLVFGTTGAVMAGSVLGDHASPISDSTILSSLGAHCDHVEHTNTQLVYAAVCGGLALAGMVVVTWTGAPWWAIYILGLSAILALLFTVGKRPADEELESEASAPIAPVSTVAARKAEGGTS